MLGATNPAFLTPLASTKVWIPRCLLAAVSLALFGSGVLVGQTIPFQRGDSNRDGGLDLSDAIHLLGFLFLGAPSSLDCADASDANDDGELDVSDAVYSLAFLFSGGVALPPPHDCGLDPSADALGCVLYPSCPTCDDILVPIPPECPEGTFVPDSPIEPWQHFASQLVVSAGAPRHRAIDLLVRSGEEQVLIGKFAYGLADRDLEDEKVEIWAETRCGEWILLGTTFTSTEGQHGTVNNVEDDGGRVFLTVPAGSLLGEGSHAVKMLVKGDHTQASCRVEVVRAGAHVVVSDLDGTLTTQEPDGSWAEVDPASAVARTNAAAVLLAYQSKGYHVVILTSRPETLDVDTRSWLHSHGFPRGIVRFSQCSGGSTSAGCAAYKPSVLASLLVQGLMVGPAYGEHLLDRDTYLDAGLDLASIRLVAFAGDPAGATVVEDFSSELGLVQCLTAIER